MEVSDAGIEHFVLAAADFNKILVIVVHERTDNIAYQDLDRTMEKILANTLAYLQTTDGQIDDMTAKTYQFYKRT